MKQKQSVFTKAVVKYTLLHESGESTIVCGYGHGVDPQDKGAGKATTYAMKNALLYTFLTPVGKIDDAETTHSNEIATPQPIVKPDLKDDKLQTSLKSGTIAELRALLVDYKVTELQRKAITIRGKELTELANK